MTDDQTLKRQPRVMHVTLTLGVGGAEQMVYRMATHGARGGDPPVVCCIFFAGTLGERFRREGGTLYCRDHKGGIDLRIALWLRRIILEERIDVVHAHTQTPLFYSVAAALTVPGVKVVYTEHGRLIPERSSWKRRLLFPMLCAGTRHIVTISESTSRAMNQYDGFPMERIRIIHNGISIPQGGGAQRGAKLAALGLSETARVVGTAARLEEIKNIPMMLRAFRLVLAELPEARLLIAGEGSRESELKEVARELGIAQEVAFLGLRNDLWEIYPLLEVFLLSSFTEGISVTLLEAMASALPAVVTDVGGNPEIVIDGRTGYLVPLHDEAMMAERTVRLLRNPGLAASLGEQGRERVRESFSFDGMMACYQALYEG